MNNKYRVDLTGKKFGKLTCLERYGKVGRHITWECLCDCGNKCFPYQTHILRGNTKSCGCLTKINGCLHKDWKGYGEISGNIWDGIKRKRRHAEDRDFSITIKYAWDLFENQQRRCALSGIFLQFDPGKKTASLDRIDSSKGYIEGNVQWVHKDINRMKNIYSQEYFIEMCSKVYNNCKQHGK